MLKLETGLLLASFNRISTFCQSFSLSAAMGKGARFTKVDYDDLRMAIRFLARVSAELGLDVPKTAFRDVDVAFDARERESGKSLLDFGEDDRIALLFRMQYANTSLRDALQAKNIYVVASTAARYFEEGHALFGPAVSEAFPAAAYDIDEAGKCLALGRSTASVFHLMRVVEIGMRSLCTSLSVSFPENGSWNKVLNEKLEPAISALPESSHKKELQHARAHLHAIRLAWRNDTMHPKATYTDEEAGEVLRHVETFMKHVALLNGRPP